MSFHAAATSFLLGVVYFIAAIPTGTALGLPVVLAMFFAWAGYTAIAAAMLWIGTPARNWITKKAGKKLEPNPEKWFWRIWQRWGMPGLGFLAPVTCGPYMAALIALTLGEKPRRMLTWIMVGALPWCILFGILSSLGINLVGPRE